MIQIFLGFLCVLIANVTYAASSQIEAEKTRDKEFYEEGSYYGSLEFRHHLNSYYDENGEEKAQDPAAHIRLQLGTTLYGGFADVYATIGVKKYAQTQQILQRRPQIAADLYPIRTPSFSLRQYTLLKLPYDRADSREGPEESDASMSGTVTVLGFSPLIHSKHSVGNATLVLRASQNAWTKFYSDKQYKDSDSDPLGDQVALAVPEETTQEEDYVQRAWSNQSLGFELKHASAAKGLLRVDGFYSSFYYPKYMKSNPQNFIYQAKRTSFYRVRLKYQLSDRMALMNDFYQFKSGFFEAKQDPSERQFRNILRLVTTL